MTASGADELPRGADLLLAERARAYLLSVLAVAKGEG
jgi:hypothetical protein